MDTQPTDIPGYLDWLRRERDVRVDRRTRTHYESVAHKLRDAYVESRCWKQLVRGLQRYGEEYLLQTGYALFTSLEHPSIVIKSYDSFLLKTFRQNVSENDSWPREPTGGWVVPENWYSRIHDVIRTMLVVKYLDGAEFMIERIRTLCEANELRCEVSFEAREEGYYAAHVNIVQEVEIPRLDFDTERIEARLEIQLTTQLQEVIRKLLHRYYERRRAATVTHESVTDWQWDYTSDEFVTNYLGHILHYVEGMIMEVRIRQERAAGRELKGSQT